MRGRSAGRPLGGDRVTAGQSTDDTTSITDAECARKQAPLGFCVCGVAIGSNLHTLRCPTCGAWARWRSAFRVAMSAIKGPQ